MTAPRRQRAPDLGELLAAQAGITASLEAVVKTLDQTRADAREARDLGISISASLAEQDVGARLADFRRDLKDEIAAIRQDFVAANTTLRKDLVAVDGRVKALERIQQRHEGITSVVSWLLKYAPWLLTVVLAGLGWRRPMEQRSGNKPAWGHRRQRRVQSRHLAALQPMLTSSPSMTGEKGHTSG